MCLKKAYPLYDIKGYMADLNYIDRDGEVKIVGQDSVGDRVNYVGADANGNLQVINWSSGSATGGTAATVSSLGGGIFNTALPTLTNGQQAAIQLDSSGRQIVVLGTSIPAGANTIGAVTQASGPWTMNLTQVSGSAITLGQALMAASLPVTIASNQSALAVSQSGAWTVAVTQSTSPWITKDQSDGPVTPGTVASFSQLVGGQYNSTLPTLTTTQQSAIQLDSSGRIIIRPLTSSDVVSAVQSGSWTVQQGTPPWIIQGDSASGASKAGNPVQIGGVFNTTQPTVTTGQTVEAQSTARGALIVATGTDAFAVNASQSGTWNIGTVATITNPVAVTQSTSPWVTKDQSDGSVAAGTAASFSSLAGLVFNTAAPTLTTGQQVALQGDSSGNLLVNLKTALPAGANTIGAVTQASGPWTQNLTQVGGSAIALGQTTMSASFPVTIASNQSALPVSQSGTWTTGRTWTLASGTDSVSVVQSTSPWVVSSTPANLGYDTNWGTVGATTLRTASIIGNQSGLANFGAGTTGAQTLRVAANTYDGFGNAITSASNGNAGQQLLNVQVPNTTVAPVALNALNAFVSIAMAGLQTVGFQLAAGTFIGTVTPQCSIDGGTNWVTCSFLNPATGGISNSFTFTTSNTLTILGIVPVSGSTNVRVIVTAYTSGTASSILSASEALSSTSQSDFIDGSGTITALNQTVIAVTAGYGSSFFNITGTWVGTITFQANNGDGVWENIYVYLSSTGSYTSSSTTVNSTAQLNCAGYYQVRAIATAWTSGTATVSWNTAAYPHQLQIYNPNSPLNVLTNAYTLDGNGNIIGSSAQTGASLYTIKPDNSTTGTLGALNATLNLPINDVSSAYALITGTWVGTIQFQGSVNGTNFVPLEAVQGGPTNAYSTAGFTANGGVRISLPAGFTSIQAVMTAYTSGTATVVINASAAPANVEVVQFNAANLSVLNNGSVTTAAPTYSTSTNQPLSLNTSGGLRVSGVTGIIDALTTQNVTTPASAIAVLGQFNTTPTTISSGNSSPLQLDNAANLLTNVKVIATDSDKNVTGTITALNGTVVIAANGTSSVNASVSGTWVGTLVMEGQSGDGIWYALAVGNPNGGLNISSFTANNLYTVGSGGFTQVRVRASAYTSGTVNVTMDASSGSAQTLAVDANGNQQIVGNVVSGTADSGNGVKTSAVYNSTLPTFTNGQRADNQSDANGAQLVSTKVPRTYSAPTTALVNTTSTLILAANANRKGLYLSNTTATQQISFGFNGNAAAYQYGLTLFPGEKFWMDEYSFSTGAIYAITSGSTTYIGIQEIT